MVHIAVVVVVVDVFVGQNMGTELLVLVCALVVRAAWDSKQLAVAALACQAAHWGQAGSTAVAAADLAAWTELHACHTALRNCSPDSHRLRSGMVCKELE